MATQKKHYSITLNPADAARLVAVGGTLSNGILLASRSKEVFDLVRRLEPRPEPEKKPVRMNEDQLRHLDAILTIDRKLDQRENGTHDPYITGRERKALQAQLEELEAGADDLVAEKLILNRKGSPRTYTD